VWLRRKPVAGLRAKWTGDGEPLVSGQVIVHGVSLGEVQLMKPLVPVLERVSGATCLLTTTTTTGWEALQAHFPKHDRAFLPLDRLAAVRRFLARTKPRALVLLELEIWPTLLAECHIRGIPVLLLNARIGDASFHGYAQAGAWLRPLFSSIALVAAQNAQWAARLIALGVPRSRVQVPGSLKADLVRPTESAIAWSWAQTVGIKRDRPLLLIASTSAGVAGHSAEEHVLLDGSLHRWRERGWQVVIAPRHPERGGEVAAVVERLGGAARLLSAGGRIDRDDAVLIVDGIGHLGKLYAVCAATTGIAVVGGSFGSGRHGQNMLEAAAAGCCTVVGPDTRNFPDAMAMLRTADAVVEMPLPVEAHRFADLASEDERRRGLGRRAHSVWAQSRGALTRLEKLLRDHWPTSGHI
jgi:3-deoxy-D-manno-octulosonic-acid transferase